MSILDWFRPKPTVLCTECGRPLKYAGRTFCDLWRGTVCRKCRVVLCHRCREPTSGPCPKCGDDMDPADSVCLWGPGHH